MKYDGIKWNKMKYDGTKWNEEDEIKKVSLNVLKGVFVQNWVKSPYADIF